MGFKYIGELATQENANQLLTSHKNTVTKRFTLVALATLIGASSVVAFSSGVKAETREEYCRHHDCGRDYYRDQRARYERDRYEREREHWRRRWYDRDAHVWRYEYR